jgi:hypothetical protein
VLFDGTGIRGIENTGRGPEVDDAAVVTVPLVLEEELQLVDGVVVIVGVLLVAR